MLNGLVPGTYTVTEADASIEGLTLQVTGEGSVTVVGGQTTSATITNIYDSDEPTEEPEEPDNREEPEEPDNPDNPENPDDPENPETPV